jgi:hypothetical protein
MRLSSATNKWQHKIVCSQHPAKGQMATNKKKAADCAAFFIQINLSELLRHRLLEHAIQLLVGRIAASLTGLSRLQSLVGSALGIVSSRLGGSSGAGSRVGSGGSRVSSSLSGSSVLAGFLSQSANFIDLLGLAASSSQQNQRSSTSFQGVGKGLIHGVIPL